MPQSKLLSGQGRSLRSLDVPQARPPLTCNVAIIDSHQMKSEEDVRKGIERSYKRALWLDEHKHWFSRVIFVPCIILAIGVTLIVFVGLSQGQIKEINRYSSTVVTLALQPVQFWNSVGYHFVLASILWGFTAIAWRGARSSQNGRQTTISRHES